MNLIFKISLRNLIRQKRRNIFLGIVIAIGMCLLIIASSFSSGISDILFNRIIVFIAGHIRIDMWENTDKKINIIRDKERMIEYINENVDGIGEIWDNIGVFTRSLGNGKAANIILVGMWLYDEYEEEFDVIEGNALDIFNKEIDNPILIYDSIAEELNVEIGDIIRTRLTTITGQIQTARFQIVGIAKADNMFMASAAFVDIDILKDMIGIKPHETQSLSIIMEKIENPYSVIQKANKLHSALKPDVAGIKGEITVKGKLEKVELFAFKTDDESKQILKERFKLEEAEINYLFLDEDSALISNKLAAKLNLRKGDVFEYRYKSKYGHDDIREPVKVAELYNKAEGLNVERIFVHEQNFYNTYYKNLPIEPAVLDHDSNLFSALLKQWKLLERSPDSESSIEKYRELNKSDWKGTTLDVQTMYELASQVLQLEAGINLVSVIAVLILFFVILIGVVNTLRMSIRERTREIGTNRAIGMQQKDVRRVFVLEIVLLTFFACILGIILSLFFMRLLSLISFNLEDNPMSIFFVNKHLHFVPNIVLDIFYFILILGISALIAYFPSKKAAKMSIAKALRHYE